MERWIATRDLYPPDKLKDLVPRSINEGRALSLPFASLGAARSLPSRYARGTLSRHSPEVI